MTIGQLVIKMVNKKVCSNVNKIWRRGQTGMKKGREKMLGKWITRHKNIILIIAFALLIPSVFGYVSTRVNYDVLSYLPNTLETVSGQDTLVDEFAS